MIICSDEIDRFVCVDFWSCSIDSKVQDSGRGAGAGKQH